MNHLLWNTQIENNKKVRNKMIKLVRIKTNKAKQKEKWFWNSKPNPSASLSVCPKVNRQFKTAHPPNFSDS